MRRLLTLSLLCILTVVYTGCTSKPVKNQGKPVIVTTLFPEYDFTKQIVKDKYDVVLLLPPGTDPHHFEPSPQDIATIHHATLLIYTNTMIEPWIDSITKNLPESVAVVNASEGIPLLDADGHSDNDEHNHTGKDPHVWLDPVNAKHMVQTIYTTLAQKDPQNKAFYKKNTEEYTKKLDELDHIISHTLGGITEKTVLSGGHFAFRYFAKRYGLTFESPYKGFSPEAEPTPQNMVEFIKRFKASGQTTIFYEEMVNPKLAKTLAEQTNGKLALLHGAHNMTKNELDSGVTYIRIMEENLGRLSAALAQSKKL